MRITAQHFPSRTAPPPRRSDPDMTPERRCLFVTTVPATVEAFLIPHATALRAAGWRVSAAYGGEDILSESARRQFDSTHRLPIDRSLAGLSRIRVVGDLLAELIERERFGVVHLHTPIAAFLGRWGLRDLRAQGRVTVLYTAHGFHFTPELSKVRHAVFSTAERVAARWTDRLIVINDDDERAAKAWGVLCDDHIVRFNGIGVDLSRFASIDRSIAARRAARRDLGIQEDAYVMVSVGELNPGKRHVDAIDVLASASAADALLLIAGQGPHAARLMRHAQKRQVASRMRLLGYRRDIPTLLEASDVLLMPSEREGLPVSVMEAMAASVPVVGADVRGTRDLLSNSRGWLHRVGDIEELGARVAEVRAGGPTVTQRVCLARTYIDAFAIEPVTRHLVELYNTLPTGHRSTPR